MALLETRAASVGIELELHDLPKQKVDKLRDRWRELFRRDPPESFGPDLLRRSIAYRIQEQTYGGLSPSAQRELDRLIKTITKSSNGRIQLPRRIKAGSVLIREWKGKSYRAVVTNEGYIYEGEKYGTLSEIARVITGTRWNGPRFFGLRKPTDENPSKRARSASDVGAAAL